MAEKQMINQVYSEVSIFLSRYSTSKKLQGKGLLGLKERILNYYKLRTDFRIKSEKQGSTDGIYGNY